MANGANATSSSSFSLPDLLAEPPQRGHPHCVPDTCHTQESVCLCFSLPPPPQVHNSKETSKGDHSLTELGSKFTIEPHPFHCSPSKHSHPVADKSAEKQLRTSAELSSSFCSPLRLKPLPRSKAEMVRSKLAHSQLQLKGSNALQRLS